MSKSVGHSSNQSLLQLFLQYAGLTALALGQPLLQLVQENPEFLVVHHARRWDVLILATVLFFLPPVILSAVVYFVGLIRAKAGLISHFLILAGLLTLILLPVVGKVATLNGWLTLALAAVPAAALAYSFGHYKFLRKNLAFLALSLPVSLYSRFSDQPQSESRSYHWR